MINKSRFGANIEAFVESPRIIRPRFLVESIWDVEHWRAGSLLSKTRDHNFCTDQGLNRLLDVMFGAEAKIATWYVLIFNGASPTTASTYAVPIYTESGTYDEVTRVEYTDVPSSGKSITNSAAKAVFTISGTVTIDGAALAGGQTVVTGPIASFADYGATVAGTVLATDVAHGRASTDVVIISGTANYNGTYVITVVDADTFYFTATWVATEAGTWTLRSSQKKADTAGGGTLYCASDFGSAKACVDNDVLNITITLTAADV